MLETIANYASVAGFFATVFGLYITFRKIKVLLSAKKIIQTQVKKREIEEIITLIEQFEKNTEGYKIVKKDEYINQISNIKTKLITLENDSFKQSIERMKKERNNLCKINIKSYSQAEFYEGIDIINSELGKIKKILNNEILEIEYSNKKEKI